MLTQHRGLRQFVKFCIVGSSSFLVNLTCLNVLYYRAHVWLIVSLSIAFLVSLCNGFYWNRRWTFKESRSKAAHTQYLQFFAINLFAWFLNTSIVILVIVHFAHPGSALLVNPGDFWTIFSAIISGKAKTTYPPLLLNGAQLAATSVVVFWTFFANRFWTFKH